MIKIGEKNDYYSCTGNFKISWTCQQNVTGFKIRIENLENSVLPGSCSSRQFIIAAALLRLVAAVITIFKIWQTSRHFHWVIWTRSSLTKFFTPPQWQTDYEVLMSSLWLGLGETVLIHYFLVVWVLWWAVVLVVKTGWSYQQWVGTKMVSMRWFLLQWIRFKWCRINEKKNDFEPPQHDSLWMFILKVCQQESASSVIKSCAARKSSEMMKSASQTDSDWIF